MVKTDYDLNVGIVIQARSGSTRLKNKIVRPFYNNGSILEIIINKFKKNKYGLPVVVASSINSENDIIELLSIKNGVEIYRGAEENVLSRFVEVCDKYGFSSVIRICSDNPFLQEKFFEQIVGVGLDNNYDYLSFFTKNDVPVIKTHLGLFTEWVSAKALKRANTATREKTYQEHVTSFIYSNPDSFQIGKIPLPEFLENESSLRFTLDTINDFNTLQGLYDICVERKIKNVEDLVDMVESDKTILQKMESEINNNTK